MVDGAGSPQDQSGTRSRGRGDRHDEIEARGLAY